MNEGRYFRLERLEVWKQGSKLSRPLFAIATQLEERRLFRFADQLRGATLSITNNIAEGSGSTSDADFANFLNMSRRSVFEVANILLVLSQDGHLPRPQVDPLLESLDHLSRMILSFMRNLRGS